MITQVLIKRFSRVHLFAPCAAFILFNFLTAYYLTTAGIYNGDFQGISLEHSNFEVWVYACIASIPYLVLYYIILRTTPIKVKPIKLPKFFIIFSLIILILSLVLTLTYGVGIIGTEIYQAPAPLKPFIVIINRIDPVVLAGILILSPYVNIRTAVLTASLLLFITLYRSSLQYVPFVLLLFYYRFMSFEKRTEKLKKNNNLSIFIIFFIISALIINIAPDLYQFRDSIRGTDTLDLEFDEFIFGKLIGRLSNLSALMMFDARYDLFYQRINELHSFSYLLDSLKYFWGSFVKSIVISHYDY